MSNADNFNPTLPLSGDNFTAFRAFIARQEGIGQGVFSSYDGSKLGYQALSGDDQIKLTNAMNAWVKQNPQVASNVQKDLANNAPIQGLEKLTVAEKVAKSEVGSSLIDTADKLNELNPLAFFDSLGKIKWAIIIIAVGAGGLWIYNKVKK